MTHSDLYDKFIRQIETEYAGTYIDSDKKSLRLLLERRIRNEEGTLSFAMFAIKQWASKLKGLPDCAVIRQAFDNYEKEYSSSLRPKSEEYRYVEEPLTANAAESTKRLEDDLAELGISIDSPKFMTKVFKLRHDRGDYGHHADRGGIIRSTSVDLSKPTTTWDTLGAPKVLERIESKPEAQRHVREGVRG